MRRVSTDLMNDDMQYWLRRQERGMASMENRMARQAKVESPRDDPLAAARAVRYDSVVQRLQRFEKNAAYADDQYRVSEGYARQALEVSQRLREIAVQGANGIYGKQDQKYMAAEVDQLLAELVELGNARGADGTYLFSGDKSRTAPFRAVLGGAPGAAGEVLTSVQYLGASGGPAAEVTERSYVELSQPGSEVFWAERQQAVSTFDARDWRAVADQGILVDGKEVQLKAGDNVYAVAAKINSSGAAVKATIDPRSFSLALETTSAHQLRLEGVPGGGAAGGALVELGLLAPTGSPPDNWAPSARVSGGSLFDVAIRLRDSLNRGDILETGGAALAGIDAGIDSLNRRVAELGARSERLQAVKARLNVEIPDTTKLLSNEADLDMTQAITDYRMLEYARNASLGMAGRLLPKTLLDFLR
ncbi:MAG TPA: flagellar hook-associated protein 3 [Spirochaetales bacterium]|nr:flagellar hook-associated protein 3 [Spirochaetales bacterium]HRY55679.1 flagellar hook-associated protein 3 [Spirochaetia bacterium]HRZ65910.1 flagellar hook-associated protein 3 [Spirochaetia bacterium]